MRMTSPTNVYARASLYEDEDMYDNNELDKVSYDSVIEKSDTALLEGKASPIPDNARSPSPT